MNHAKAIRAMDEHSLVRSEDDDGFIVALGGYDTSHCHTHEREHPLNKRGWALVAWNSGVRTWARRSDLSGGKR